MKTKIAYIIAGVTTALLVLCSCSGCASYKLPAINAAEFTYRRTDPAGGTQIKATNVKVTDEKVTAETASWNTTYPQWSLTVEVKGYERQLTPKEKEEKK